MKTRTVNIARLKASLSQYLHELGENERLVVLDRKRPVAEIRALPDAEDPHERLARRYPGYRRGTQAWDKVHVTVPRRPLGLVDTLLAMRADQP